jgi:2-C-methyl-D-erythritol 4-phosphate cytidylyltransferase
MDSILKIINKFKETYTINNDDILCLCDANRPLVNKELYTSVIEGAATDIICCPARPLVDGVALVEDGYITSIPEKSGLQTIQTPEACNFHKLIQLIENGKHHDKLGLCEIFLGAGIKPKVVKSDHRTHKVTYPGDIKILEALMEHDDEQL